MRFFLVFFLLFALHSFSQREESVDFIRVRTDISPNPYLKSITGRAEYEFDLLEKVDTVYLDAVDMVFDEVKLNRKRAKFTISKNKLAVKAPRKLGKHLLSLTFSNTPSQTVYFVDWDLPDSLMTKNEHLKKGYRRMQSMMDIKLLGIINKNRGQIWTQGQGKYTSRWLPSIDDMNDKMEFDLTFRTEKKYEVIANGRLVEKKTEGGVTTRRFDMNRPMSSYLTAFVMGTFDKKVVKSKSDIPIELYFEPKDSLKVEPTYRYSKEIFDFLEGEIGVAYPWQNYKQVPVQDFLYAGMENTTCTIFSNQYVVDSTAFVDKNYVNVNAHELAHQWFGNLVTEESGEHHWLHEGFATYYAYLAEKELFGENHFYWKLYQTAKTLHNLSENEGGEALTNPNANSLTFYEKGAWALVLLREQIGDKAFKKGIQSYLNTHAFKNVTIPDFLIAMEKASQSDLNAYRQKWLESEEFPWEEVKDFLSSKNESLKLFFEFQDRAKNATAFDEKRFVQLWKEAKSIPFKREYLSKYATKISDSILVEIVQDESLLVRQAAALAIPKVTEALRPVFESIFKDRSYITQETVLFKLWQAFPQNRKDYLDQLDDVLGLPNKNVRLLWLALALVTPDYQNENKNAFYEELNGYSDKRYNFEVRRLAFQYLHQIQALNDKSLQNLIQAANHHVWQFKKSSRNLLREINESDEGKARLSQLSLNEQEKELLNKILSP